MYAQVRITLLLVSVMLAFAPSALQAELVVTDWNLATRTYNPSQAQYQSSLILTIQNPLQNFQDGDNRAQLLDRRL